MINGTNAVFNNALTDNVVDGVLLKNLQKDVFLFSGLKTHAQLFEASRLLLDDNKKIKPFSQFSQEVLKLNQAYNQRYLEAEHEFAINSAQMADKWANLSDNTERYFLQYRTAGDERVRQSHKNLRDVTLPKEDAFWNSYYPPNGWNCRCTVVEVLKSTNTASNSQRAITAGEKATTQIGKNGKNKLEIFRFNPGKQKVIFPPEHPYSKVQGAKTAKSASENLFFKELQHQTKVRLVDGQVTVKRSELKSPITFTTKGIKEAFNQPHYNKPAKNQMLANIDTVLKQAKYLGEKEDYKHNIMVRKIHVFETNIDNQKTYLINRELISGEIHFYSVSDGENLLIGIKK